MFARYGSVKASELPLDCTPSPPDTSGANAVRVRSIAVAAMRAMACPLSGVPEIGETFGKVIPGYLWAKSLSIRQPLVVADEWPP